MNLLSLRLYHAIEFTGELSFAIDKVYHLIWRHYYNITKNCVIEPLRKALMDLGLVSSPGWFFPNHSTLAASPLQPEVEHGTCDQQEEHASYKAPGKDIGLIEVTPGNKDGHNNSRYSDHLALQCDPYRTPPCVKGDAYFTNPSESKQTTHDPCSQRRQLPWPDTNHKIGS